MKAISKLKILFFVLSIVLVSCSKDSSPDEQVTPITVSASDFTVTIDENPSAGQSLGTLIGTTNMGSVVFSVLNQTPSGSFTINSNSGDLTVADAENFNFEQNPVITGTVAVSNGAVSKEASLTINLIDVLEKNTYNGDVILLTQEEVENFGENNYTHITGHLYIGEFNTENTSITNLTPLLGLRFISKSLDITKNNALVNLEGLNNVVAEHGLVLQDNDALVDITALSNFGAFEFSLNILSNDSLTSLSGLENVTSIGSYIFIYNNASLASLEALSNIRGGVTSLLVQDNDSLLNLNGLGGINHVDEGFSAAGNEKLINLDGLNPSIQIVGYVHVALNSSLRNINALNGLTTTGSLTIGGNPMLENLQGLNSLTILNGAITITDNDLLTNLNELGNVRSTLSSLEISGNDSLINIAGLTGLTELIYIVIDDNDMLEDLDGLSGITNILKNILIIENNSLTDYCALENLIINHGWRGTFLTVNNAYNVYLQDIIDGNCSL